MASISLARIDDRLVHGQVVTKWIPGTKSNKVIIIDGMLSKNSFLADVFKMAAPVGVTVTVKSPEEAGEEWKKNKFGMGNVMLLFKNPQSVESACKAGLRINKLQVAGMGSSSGKRVVYKTVSLSKDDAQSLKRLNEQGIEVYFQALPDDKQASLSSIIKKYFKSL